MELEDSADVLPADKVRQPIIYLIVHPDAEGKLVLQEEPNRRAARKYVNGLADPSVVQCIYRVTGKIALAKKVVMSF